MAAIEELFGDMKECERRYMSAQVLLHSLVQRHPLHPQHRTTLSKCQYRYHRILPLLVIITSVTPTDQFIPIFVLFLTDRDAVQRRLNCLKGPRKIMDVKLEAGIS